jgi:hypothetical protein
VIQLSALCSPFPVSRFPIPDSQQYAFPERDAASGVPVQMTEGSAEPHGLLKRVKATFNGQRATGNG